MRIKVHVQGIKGSGLVKEGDEASALFQGVLEVDGVLIEEVAAIEAVFSGGDFAAVKAELIPGSFEVVTHTDESWPQLLQRIDEKNEARAGSGRLVAKVESG